jgi:di/tricarboxylate transporter
LPSLENLLLLAILAAAVGLFISEKLRPDVTAVCVLAALAVSGLIRPGEILYGFANPATAVVAAMFVISAGLVRTGLVDWLVRRIDRAAGRGRTRLLLVLGSVTLLLSTFIVNTAVVAVIIPVVFALAKSRRIPVSSVLMPLAFASQLGGVCTLIGSSTNILMNSVALAQGLPGFELFEFAPLGLILAAAGLLYLILWSGRLLPKRKAALDKIDRFRLAEYLTELTVQAESGLIGKRWESLEEAEFKSVALTGLIRSDKPVKRPPRTVIREGDVLQVRGDADRLLNLESRFHLKTRQNVRRDKRGLDKGEADLIEALVPPRSPLVGRPLDCGDFRRRFGGSVLALQRRGSVIRKRMERIRLAPGDTLLLQSTPGTVSRILRSKDLIVISELTDLHLRRSRAAIALGLLAAVVAAAALNWIPLLTAVILGGLGMVLTGCLTPEEAYQAIDWQVIFLLGGILPLGLALQQTGTAAWLAGLLLEPLRSLGPTAVLAAVYLLSGLMTEGMSSPAAAVLLAPVALSASAAMGVSPRPFLVAVTVAASTSFATPIGFQTNTMIYGPGGYRFFDFTRTGGPLNLLFWGLSTWLIPCFWPF